MLFEFSEQYYQHHGTPSLNHSTIGEQPDSLGGSILDDNPLDLKI
jgi:hypothetical protein